MNRKLATFAFVAAAAIGSAAHAATATHEELMDICLQEFVKNNFADYQGKVTVKKPADDVFTSTGPLLTASPVYEIKVAAIGNPSGKPFATATCKLTRSGIVLKSQPLAALKKLKATAPEVMASNQESSRN